MHWHDKTSLFHEKKMQALSGWTKEHSPRPPRPHLSGSVPQFTATPQGLIPLDELLCLHHTHVLSTTPAAACAHTWRAHVAFEVHVANCPLHPHSPGFQPPFIVFFQLFRKRQRSHPLVYSTNVCNGGRGAKDRNSIRVFPEGIAGTQSPEPLCVPSQDLHQEAAVGSCNQDSAWALQSGLQVSCCLATCPLPPQVFVSAVSSPRLLNLPLSFISR